MTTRFVRRSLAYWVVIVLISLLPVRAFAGHATFEYYYKAQGLTDGGGSCILQIPGGYMLVCTQQGLYSYDGRRFENLGPKQGLREGGFIDSIVITSSGRVAITYPDQVYVSDTTPSGSHPPTALHFSPVANSHPYYAVTPHQLVAWRNGLAIIAGDVTYFTSLDGHELVAHPISYSPAEKSLLRQPDRLFMVRGQLWETVSDDRICRADPGAVRCYPLDTAQTDQRVFDVVAGGGVTLLLRLSKGVVTLDPVSGTMRFDDLPDQGGRYVNYPSQLGFFRLPGGRLVTQADRGLAILDPTGWGELTVDDGAPAGTIMSAVADAAGQMWFQLQGAGVARWVGFGHWETLQRSDGLSEGIPWVTVRPPDGSVWLSTDSGVDVIARVGSSLRVAHVVPGGSFALCVGPRGMIWASWGGRGLEMIEPNTFRTVDVAGPTINFMTPAGDGSVWLATDKGLFRAHDATDQYFAGKPRGAPDAQALSVVRDGDGGAIYLSDRHLRHRHSDGTDTALSGSLPANGFGPITMALGNDGSLWLGGTGGLLHLTVVGDRVTSLQEIPDTAIPTSTVPAVMVDHRGWIWIGTALGISVYDGSRWVSADSGDGLLDDDVSEGGIREDPDGSVWIVTSQGLSHLTDPASLFMHHPLDVVISDAVVGDRIVGSSLLPFTTDPLSLQFGTTSYGAERSVLFRYRLDGVDAAWAETATGTVRYPFVTPGRHLLTVVAIDPLTHTVSPPAHLLIRMAYPWWRQWWAELLWFVLAVATLYVLLRLRVRALTARQRELQRRIDAATEEIRAAEVELRYRATHDGITGLLNRTEVERRLADELATVPRRPGLMVALADLDHFKRVNDTLGHLAGDTTLRSLGGLVERILRPGEYAGRYGGEEVLIVLDDTDAGALARIATLHAAVRGIRPGSPSAEVRITCSFGVAWERAGDSWETLIGRADAALYEAKQSGRDRIAEDRAYRRKTAAK